MRGTYNTYKYYFFYKTTNIVNGKYYYGVHSTNDINDKYLGSGKLLRRAINKYGAENFSREILKMFVNRESMYEYEKNFITDDLLKDPMCYNVNVGGRGGFSKEMIEIIANKNKGSHRTPEQRKHISEAGLKRNWVMSDKHRNAISNAMRTNNVSKRPEVKAKISTALRNTKWMTNGVCDVRVNESKFDFYLNNGYHFGRTYKKIG